MTTTPLRVHILSELLAQGIRPEYLFWVGCAGSFDYSAKKITKAFVKILNTTDVSFAILGTEETCNGDPAKRVGNDFLFQIQALTVIETLKKYEVTKIITTCPHCFNIFKNDYPSLGGHFKVIHHTQLLKELIDSGKLNVEENNFNGKKITYHDPCYLSRANNIFETPREVLNKLGIIISEMKSCKKDSMCCGAGGGQMFKESENGTSDISTTRINQAMQTDTDIIATSCPFCKIMLSDAVIKKKNTSLKIVDLTEIIANTKNI